MKGVKNLRIANSDSALWQRKNKEDDYLDARGLRSKVNLGRDADLKRFIDTLDELGRLSEESNTHVINEISRNGSVGAERLG